MDQESAHMRGVLDVISDIENQETAEKTFQIFRTFTRSLGGRSLVVGKMVNPIIEGQNISAFGFADWPEEWRKKWIKENYIIHDPISQYALKTHTTFNWEDAFEHATDFGKRVYEEGQQYISAHGIAIPIKAGHLPPGIVSIGFDDGLPSPRDTSMLEMASIHCYTHLLRLLDTLTQPAEVEKLTKRETDVLNFVAAGKTNWEVAHIFGISEHSVAQHMKNISRKMNATNRAHAVTLAIKSGQIIA